MTEPVVRSAETESLRRAVGRLTTAMTLGSAGVAALIGAIAAVKVGPFLAMGAAMYLGNTEPQQPSGAYPWDLLLGCIVVAVAGILLTRRDRPVAGHTLVMVGALAAALLPLLHLYRLYQLT